MAEFRKILSIVVTESVTMKLIMRKVNRNHFNALFFSDANIMIKKL
jgi:hypothetical protein